MALWMTNNYTLSMTYVDIADNINASDIVLPTVNDDFWVYFTCSVWNRHHRWSLIGVTVAVQRQRWVMVG
jgi:hypothetical protein